jgi:ABC-type lipoprotein export system ATPase subunit
MIKIRNLVKGYTNPETGNFEPVISIESLDIPSDGQYAVSGPSGTGKTTFLHLISGLLKPEQGSVEINGTVVNSLSESARDQFRANNIGYIFQTFNLIDGYSALENVMLGMVFAGNGADKNKAQRLLESVGLSHRLHYKPSELSVGQQQRVCVARALANNPAILLADEPTGNLDPQTTSEILELLKAQSKGRMLIVVSHETEVLNQFNDRIELSRFNPTQTTN